jgi:hypothetical protein
MAMPSEETPTWSRADYGRSCGVGAMRGVMVGDAQPNQATSLKAGACRCRRVELSQPSVAVRESAGARV